MLAPEEIVRSFFAFFLSPDAAAEAELTVTAASGEISLTGSGWLILTPGGSRSYQELGDYVVETITIDAVTFTRRNDGPWLSDEEALQAFALVGDSEAPPAIDLEVSTWLETLGTLDHDGEETENGRTIHRLIPSNGFDPSLIGYASSDEVTVDAVFWADEDGMPYAIDMSVDDRSDPDSPLVLETRMKFVGFEPGEPVEAPTDAWRLHRSSDLGYTIGLPPMWDVQVPDTDGGHDLLFGFEEELQVYRTELEAPQAVPLNGPLGYFRQTLTSDLAASFGDPAESLVNGLPARFVSFSYDDDLGGPVSAVYLVTQVSENVVFEFVYYDVSGDASDDVEMILDFLSTFALDA